MTSEAIEGIGERIKRLREARGLSPKEFAKRGEFSRQTLEQNEKGLRVPSTRVLDGMARVLGVSVEHILHGTVSPQQQQQHVSPQQQQQHVSPQQQQQHVSPINSAAIASLHGLADAMLPCATKEQWIAMIHMWSEGVSARKSRD